MRITVVRVSLRACSERTWKAGKNRSKNTAAHAKAVTVRRHAHLITVARFERVSAMPRPDTGSPGPSSIYSLTASCRQPGKKAVAPQSANANSISLNNNAHNIINNNISISDNNDNNNNDVRETPALRGIGSLVWGDMPSTQPHALPLRSSWQGHLNCTCGVALCRQ